MTQTAIEWLIEQCPRIETIVASSVLEQAKEMEKQQIEISDEEIEKAVKNPMHDAYDFREGAKWYREQLKNNI
jgi:hypothetical protein